MNNDTTPPLDPDDPGFQAAPGLESTTTPVESVPLDFFGFSTSEKWYFPGQKLQFLEIQIMNEGAKAKYQKRTQKDLILERKSGDARMKVDAATERHELITASVIGWNVYRGGSPIPFTTGNLNDLLRLADPRVIESLEKAIRKANPWLLDEMSSEDIQKEIDNLNEMLEVAKERERGEGSSSSK